MRKLREIIGLEILDGESGGRLGEVTDLAVSVEGAAVRGLVADWAERKNVYISFAGILAIGERAVLLRRGYDMQQADGWLRPDECYASLLWDKEILTDSGRLLGIAADMLFSPADGELHFYILSDSLVTDILYGRRYLPLPPVQTVGRDSILVPAGMEELVKAAPDRDTVDLSASVQSVSRRYGCLKRWLYD